MALGLHEDVLSTIDGFYAAASGTLGWAPALDRLLQATGFASATAYAIDRSILAASTRTTRLPVRGLWHRLDPGGQREYETEYFQHAPNRWHLLDHPDTRLRHDHLHSTEAEMDRNAYYAWLEQAHDRRYHLAGHTDLGQPHGTTLCLQRPRRHGHATEAEIRLFERLFRHFERAARLEFALGATRLPGDGVADLLEGNPTGIVMLDGLRRTVFANRAARAMAAERDSIALGADGLTALRPCDDQRLQRLIGAAINRSGGGALRLPRRSGRREHALLVTPLDRRAGWFAPVLPAACVLITDPHAAPRQSPALLREAYGVTAAEARLVQRLIAGDTPEQAARQLGIALPNVRRKLASLYRKTETGRHSELVRLLVALPWWSAEGERDGGG